MMPRARLVAAILLIGALTACVGTARGKQSRQVLNYKIVLVPARQ